MSILVICEHDLGAFKKTAFELLGKAKSMGLGEVHALVIGHDGGAELGAYGADQVHTVSGAAYSAYSTGTHTRAIQAGVAVSGATIVLAAASADMRDCMPRLAARLGAGMASECTELRVEGGQAVGRRPMYAGKAFADVHISSSLAIFTVRPNSFGVPAAGEGSAPVTALAVELQDGDQHAQTIGRESGGGTVADLTEADRIVSGGRTVESAENYDKLIRPLAASVGATPGASRAAVDAGYVSHSHQVGQTGKVVNPSLYIACGISGAIQHLAGMRTSKVIVAINTDPDAPIFQHATYGIVGDMFEVVPALTEEFKAALS